MATHSNILAWRSLWTQELGRPQSTGSQRVRHDQAFNTFTLSTEMQIFVITGKHIEKLQSVWGKWCELLTSPTLIPLQLDFASHPIKGLNQFPHPLNLTGLVICFDPWNSERACCVTSKPRSQETLGSVVKNPLASTRDMDLIPGSGGSPREGNGNPLPYSCMKDPMDRGT